MSAFVGFGAAEPLLSPGSGLVTSVAVTRGYVLEPGTAFMTINNLSVYLNPLPFLPHRMIESGVQGDDVEMLEEFLVGEGFFDRGPDDRFTRATMLAIEAWQAQSSMEVTGKINPAQFMAVPDKVQVDEVLVRVGDVISRGQQFASSTNDVPVITAWVLPSVAGRIPDDVVSVIRGGGGDPVAISLVSVGELVSDESGFQRLQLFLAFDVVNAEAKAMTGGTVLFLLDERVDVVSVPVTALLSAPDSSGASTVLVVTSPGTEPVRTAVRVGLVSEGVAEIVEGLSVGDTVVIGFEHG